MYWKKHVGLSASGWMKEKSSVYLCEFLQKTSGGRLSGEKIVNVIDKYGIDHGYIEIELTESEDFQNYEIMSEIVDGLRSEGIATSIDDFGTGYSSLNMIKKVDLNVIKIDKSFIPMETEYPGKETDMVMLSVSLIWCASSGRRRLQKG